MAGEHCLSKFLCSLLHFGELDWRARVIASVQQDTPIQTNSGHEAEGKPGEWGGGKEGERRGILVQSEEGSERGEGAQD